MAALVDGLMDELVKRLRPMLATHLVDEPPLPMRLDSRAAAKHLGMTYDAFKKYQYSIPSEQSVKHGKHWYRREELDRGRPGAGVKRGAKGRDVAELPTG